MHSFNNTTTNTWLSNEPSEINDPNESVASLLFAAAWLYQLMDQVEESFIKDGR